MSGRYLRRVMSVQIRRDDTMFFRLPSGSVGRSEWVRGDFDVYDGAYTAIRTKWWLEINGGQFARNIADIDNLIETQSLDDAVGLAMYFAHSRDLGDALRPDYTNLLNFEESFTRLETQVIPRIAENVLFFVTRKSLGDPIATHSEFWDNSTDLDRVDLRSECFWSGPNAQLQRSDRK